MITYCNIRHLIEDSYDYKDLLFGLILIILTLVIDIALLLIQPILFIVVRKYEKENL